MVQLPLPTHWPTATQAHQKTNKADDAVKQLRESFLVKAGLQWIPLSKKHNPLQTSLHYHRQTGTHSLTGGKSNNSDRRLLGSIQPLTSSLLWWIACSDAVIRWLRVCACIFVCEVERTVCSSAVIKCVHVSVCSSLFVTCISSPEKANRGVEASLLALSCAQCTQTYQTLTRSDAWARLIWQN